jgi:hypothetical protein
MSILATRRTFRTPTSDALAPAKWSRRNTCCHTNKEEGHATIVDVSYWEPIMTQGSTTVTVTWWSLIWFQLPTFSIASFVLMLPGISLGTL